MYPNSIQPDDYFIPLHFLTKQNLSEISLVNDALLFDESYTDSKQLSTLFITHLEQPLSVHNSVNYPQSHHSILNNFRADYEDFSPYSDNVFLPKVNKTQIIDKDGFTN